MSSDEDDFTCYGNALDPIDEDSIPRKKPITVEDQYAKDERGRRRFHGAFTGGFSAGFFNSVGSVEGWRPANFVSSRTNRTLSKDQSIFDFMDEEDTGEYGICPMSLQVKPTFDAKTSKNDQPHPKKRSRIAANEQHSVLDTSFVREMLAPTRDTVGVKLLVKMGWRPGQGVGPRISRKEKKLHQRQTGDSKKMYGCRLPTDFDTMDDHKSDDDSRESSSEPEFEGDLDDLTFAPNDYEAYIANPKQNAFGLGYQGIDRKPVLSSARPELSVLTVAGKSIRGQAFGVSVFEDDDDDIYNTEDMSNYDFSLPYVGETKCAQQKSTSPKNTNCIEGFYVSTIAASKTRQPFVLPSIPKDFQPLRLKKNRWDCTDNVSSFHKAKISHASERSKLLGGDEKKNESENVNTSSSDCIRISDIPLPESTSSQQNQKQETSNKNAPVDIGCVRPFAYDKEKQDRYEKFLALKNASQFLEMPRIYPTSMTEWEKEREKYEFEQAARLYRPLAEDLACRFTRGSRKEDVHDISAPVERSYDAEFETLQNAAKNKMYGALTRKTYVWKPDKVICKRFNIPEPLCGAESNTSECISKQQDRKGSLFQFLKMSTCNANVNRLTDNTTTRSRSQSPQPVLNHETKSNSSHQSSTQQRNPNMNDDDEGSENDEQIENITDKIDLFKAIFLSSSDDENDEEASRPGENQLKKPEKNENVTALPISQQERNIDTETETTVKTQRRDNKREIRYSPARGIFANLDLESLKCKPSFCKNEPSDQSTVTQLTTTHTQDHNQSSETNTSAALLYGPKIPNSLYSKTTSNNSENPLRLPHHFNGDVLETSCKQQSRRSSSPVWVEKSRKHKSKKHKKRHKKQKKSKRKKEK